jgi:alpha-ribazole phosphatase
VALTVHFVRHARATDVEGRCIGHTDRELSLAGLAECATLASSCVVRDMRCISSDLRRAQATAAQLTTATVALEPRLREMSFGDWEDRTWAELEENDGTRLSAWMQNWTAVRAPNGESFADVVLRTREWLATLPRDGSDLLVVAHAGSIRAAAVALLDVPESRAFSYAVDHVHVSTFTLSTHGATLLRWNSPRF